MHERFGAVLSTMQGQAKLSQFFAPTDPKRSQSFTDECSSSKRVKIEEEVEDRGPDEGSTGISLSPEQKRRIETRKKEAQKVLTRKKSPTGMGSSWNEALSGEFTRPYFTKVVGRVFSESPDYCLIQLSRFVEEERTKNTVYPPVDLVYSWTLYCKIDEIKVVILGQDPYHHPKQAHGLCFSVPHGVPAPPSLINIYKELESDIEGFVSPKHGNLESWAKQGVLLLNACLTVQAYKANSHKDKGWETFTDAVINVLNKQYSNIVFLLWGAYAQKKGSKIDKKKHCVLKSAHPSPLAAYKGFFGCKHFSQANDYLKKNQRKPIDWKCLPKSDGKV